MRCLHNTVLENKIIVDSESKVVSLKFVFSYESTVNNHQQKTKNNYRQ